MEEASTSSGRNAADEKAVNLMFQCPVLTSTNYSIWSLRIKAIFKAHGIWEAIDPGTSVDQKKDNSATAVSILTRRPYLASCKL